MIKIGIVGTGATMSIAHFHAEGYKKDPRCCVAAVYDINREAAEKWAADHGLSARICGSYRELLECCDAVDLCTPNFLHAGQGLGAIRAGKHLLVEKPMAITGEECETLAAAAGKSSACAMVGMVYRYAGPVLLARRMVREEIGPVYTFTAWTGGKRLADPAVPLEWRMIRERSGSGALGDFGSHLLDLADYVAGQRYDRVTCRLGTFIPERTGPQGTPQPVENDDAAVFSASGPGGLGSFTVSRVGLDDIMMLLAGEGGMLQVSLRVPEQVTYWEKKRDGGYTGVVKSLELPPQKHFDDWFVAETAAFLDGIQGRREGMPDLAQGLYIQRVLDAAQAAHETGNTQEVAL